MTTMKNSRSHPMGKTDIQTRTYTSTHTESNNHNCTHRQAAGKAVHEKRIKSQATEKQNIKIRRQEDHREQRSSGEILQLERRKHNNRTFKEEKKQASKRKDGVYSSERQYLVIALV